MYLTYKICTIFSDAKNKELVTVFTFENKVYFLCVYCLFFDRSTKVAHYQTFTKSVQNFSIHNKEQNAYLSTLRNKNKSVTEETAI